MVDSGVWQDEDDLAEAYLRRKGFAYGVDGSASRHDAVLSHMLARVEVSYQNLDSVELGVTTVDHYFDTLGGISRAVKQARGGQEAAIYIGDQTRGAGTVRTLSEQVSLETRTRALNPKWYEALLSHGYEGVRQIEAQVTNTMGWSATTGQVQPWVYEKLTETFVLDSAMQERLASLEPEGVGPGREPADRGARAPLLVARRGDALEAPARRAKTWKTGSKESSWEPQHERNDRTAHSQRVERRGDGGGLRPGAT
jgi:magnesium chelatase subunit H